MSEQKKQAEHLTFGYVKESYYLAVPIALIQLIQLYYDIYYYLSLKGEELQKLLASNIGDKFYFKSFKIKGIEFQFAAAPNGIIDDNKGLFIIGTVIKYLPKDIKYFNYYQQIKCEQLNDCDIIKNSITIKTGNEVTPYALCKISELKDMNRMDFNCLININYIKYKKESKKDDYIGSINKIQRMSKFKWNMNGSMMAKCKKMQTFQQVVSDNFNDNNWFLRLYPNGFSKDTEGGTAICIFAASLSLNRKTINIKLTLFIDGVQFKQSHIKKIGNDKYNTCWIVMAFNEFKERESILFEVVMEIINVYDENDKEIEQKEWDKYGVVS